jgi:hypothetical protein
LHGTGEEESVLEIRLVTELLEEIVDVLECGCVFVSVVLALGVFVGFTVRVPENV